MQQHMKQWWVKIYTYKNSIWPAILWSALIFVLLAVPFKHRSEQSLLPLPHFDKVIHVLLFCILSFLWSEYAKSKHSYKTIHIIFIIFSSILYGVVLEYIQHYTGRDFDPLDMIANTCGVLIWFGTKKSRTKL